MLGIVLCGGQSTRMGTDKGLIVNEARTWAQSAVDKLSALHLPVKISVNEKQYNYYCKVFAADDLITDDKSLVVGGPLLGVLSAHLQHPTSDLFLLACDMLLMESKLLKELYNTAVQQKNYEAYVFSNNNHAEPLCAIYTAVGLSKIVAALKNNQLQKHSMKYALNILSTFSTPLQETQKKYFRNFNAHAELNGL
jgi:molybdenum cofactor guanylyltransferase